MQTKHFEIDIHSRMASLDDKIAALEAEIEGYKLELKDATTREDKSELRGLIKSTSDYLTRLLDEKKTQSAVGGAGVLSAGRHLYLRKYLS